MGNDPCLGPIQSSRQGGPEVLSHHEVHNKQPPASIQGLLLGRTITWHPDVPQCSNKQNEQTRSEWVTAVPELCKTGIWHSLVLKIRGLLSGPKSLLVCAQLKVPSCDAHQDSQDVTFRICCNQQELGSESSLHIEGNT